MQKLITMRFPGKCKRCKNSIPSGARAIWLGKGAGVQHETCTSQIDPPKPKENASGVDEFTIDYAELRESFAKFIDNPASVYTNPNSRETGIRFRDSLKTDSGWVGCSVEEMHEFIRSGYRVQGMEGISSLIPARPRRKVRYADEGDELLLDLVWSGSDEPFMEWEKRVSKPGLSVEIHLVFHAGFPAPVIVQYQKWIAQALQTLDENGVDMEVNIVMTESGSLFHNDASRPTKTSIRVRKPGEAADFANWSAMFSPGGFRMLGIMAIGIHGDRHGGGTRSGHGRPQPYGSWEVAYDPERNVIVFGNSQTEREFPEFEMTEKLRAVLAKVNG